LKTVKLADFVLYPMDSGELKKRIKDFAHRCIKLALALPDNALGKHIRIQLIRCATSAAANYRAVCIAQTKAAFIAKISIVAEETDKSCFWLQFVTDEKLLSVRKVQPLLNEGEELTCILLSSRITARNKKR